MLSVPSVVTTQPGVPRLSSAADQPASPTVLARGDTAPPGDTPDPDGPEPPALLDPAARVRTVMPGVTASISADARLVATAPTAAARSVPATMSTGRSLTPRTSAPGTNASARVRAAGTQTRAMPPVAS